MIKYKFFRGEYSKVYKIPIKEMTIEETAEQVKRVVEKFKRISDITPELEDRFRTVF